MQRGAGCNPGILFGTVRPKVLVGIETHEIQTTSTMALMTPVSGFSHVGKVAIISSSFAW